MLDTKVHQRIIIIKRKFADNIYSLNDSNTLIDIYSLKNCIFDIALKGNVIE